MNDIVRKTKKEDDIVYTTDKIAKALRVGKPSAEFLLFPLESKIILHPSLWK